MASSDHTTTSTIARSQIHNDPYPKVPKDTLIDPFPHTAIGDASSQIDIQSDIEISAGRANLSYNMSTAAGPSGSNPSTSTTLPPQASSSVHVHPHGAHLDRTTGAAVAGIEDDEHDYESLPEGYGWAVNMAAGALVRLPIDGVVCVGVLISSLFRLVFRNTLSSSPSTL
jgi:hypothetical protein